MSKQALSTGNSNWMGLAAKKQLHEASNRANRKAGFR
jgi:hypothetical protein